MTEILVKYTEFVPILDCSKPRSLTNYNVDCAQRTDKFNIIFTYNLLNYGLTGCCEGKSSFPT